MSTAAYGAGKAGGTFDPLTFVKKPQVVLKLVCFLFGVIVYWCISSGSWYPEGESKKEVCLFNKDASACMYGSTIGFFGLLGAAAFVAGEYFFEQMSSAKSRKHFVIGDMGFSGLWALLYFISFCYLANQWSDTSEKDVPESASTGDAYSAILFSFFSIFTWAGSAWFAYQRFLQGVEGMDFPSAMPEAAQYNSYPDTEGGDEYQQPPAY
ncbi:hypothetical protein M8J76_004532 [Diaphorina citri]|nr:hypothetical protein M8J75_009904 [Diaphorina citri]KAI5723337.1 hypothetical protein M8J76_004532 [Diaphorina citri]KAI5728847.1 hypothetical protein M8J77_022168 [Diaphorina citri]